MKKKTSRNFNSDYTGKNTGHIAFPLGGIGAGMICLTGAGGLSHVSLRHRPEVHNEPQIFAAVNVEGIENGARILQGPVPDWKIFAQRGAGNGLGDRIYGLPRFSKTVFRAAFPFASVSLAHPKIPLDVKITGWSPFVPGDSDSASIPVAALEYDFTNATDKLMEMTFSFHTANLMRLGDGKRDVRPINGGVILSQEPDGEHPHGVGAFCVECDAPGVSTDCAWFRGTCFDTKTMLWRNILRGKPIQNPPHEEGEKGLGASLYVPIKLDPGESKKVTVRCSWYAPESDISIFKEPEGSCEGCKKPGKRGGKAETYRPFYATKFKNIDSLAKFWRTKYADLRARSKKFSRLLYNSSLKPEVIESIAANLTILKSPTVLRQHDGRLWGWEGCCDESGCCYGSCTHVWNYAQALPHLFPDLERSLRETEFNENQDERGHQVFRANLPIKPVLNHDTHFRNAGAGAAADGQLGGILKVFRDWRIGGEHEWLSKLWPKVKQSLDYCIKTWDPGHTGALTEPHHNTYDIEFWGPDGMCTSFYLGALEAAARMAEHLGDDSAGDYRELYKKGRNFMENELFNGEYFIQKIQWENLHSFDPAKAAALMGRPYSKEALKLLEKEGPKYQYGQGCLSDGVLGDWMARVSGLGAILDPEKVKSHLLSVHRYNFRHDLSDHANPQRPTFAMGSEAGLLLCTWPHGGELSLPFIFSDEVWTGIEYQVASHLIFMGCVQEGLEIVRAARSRYDGIVRNPFDEYECGHWYARAMSSYGLIQAIGGAWYDAVDEVLYLNPAIEGDFTVLLSTGSGYGIAGLRGGKPFVEVSEGKIQVKHFEILDK